MTERNNSYTNLGTACAIMTWDGLLPGVSPFKLAGVSIVLPTVDLGNQWIQTQKEDLDKIDSEISLHPVSDTWTFMREAAAQGLGGFVLIHEDHSLTAFMFMTRIEETGNDWPTVLCAVDETGIIASITRTGERQFHHSELVHWERFDLTDPVTAKWGIERPFRDWSYGDPLYELRDDNWLLRISHHPLLGPWIGIDGGFAIFTSEDEALHYLQHHAATDQNRMDFLGELSGLQNGLPPYDLRPHPLLDLAARADELLTHNPFASICINPDGHRENMGYVSEGSCRRSAIMGHI